MKFSIGDKVLLKRTGEEGIVAGYINPEMFEVEAGGTVFPVHADDLEHPYLKWFTEKKREKQPAPMVEWPQERVKEVEAKLATGVYLSLLPVYKPDEQEDVVDLLKIFLLNEMAFPVRYRYEVRTTAGSLFFHEGTLHAFSHVHLHHIPYGDMNDQPRFHWLVADADSSRGLKEAGGILRIRPAKLFAEVMDLRMRNEPMFSYLLVDSFAPDIPEVKPAKPVLRSVHRPKKERPAQHFQDLPRYELDLHIERLVEDTAGLSNAEMLEVQMVYLKRYLNLAVAHRFERMIIIHGLGRGVLRDAVHEVLKEMPEVDRFTNEWLGKYGFGATEVCFSY